MTIEPESDMWADHKVNFDHYRYRDGMFASVDVAHIIVNFDHYRYRDGMFASVDVAHIIPVCMRTSLSRYSLAYNATCNA